MFSQKMFELGNESSSIREIAKKAAIKKAEIGAENVYDFSLGNPNADVPKKLNETLVRFIQEKDMVHGYTANVGDANTRAAIAKDISERFHYPTDAEDIYMTCGAAASLTISLKAITEPGDEVIIIAPFFPEYQVFIQNAKAKVVIADSKEDFSLDMKNIERKITKKTKAIILNSPNNPTGKVYSEEELKQLAKLLIEKSTFYGRPIFIISDEPYREIIFDGKSHVFTPTIYDDTIICYSYSKSMCLAGERIGYIMTNQKMTEFERLRKAIAGAGRSQGFVCAPSLFQYAIAENIREFADISLYERNREWMVSELQKIGYEIERPEGAFYIFMKSLEKDSRKFSDRATKYHLYLVPGLDFYRDGYVRISICVAEQTCKDSIPAFQKLFNSYQK